MIDLKKCYRCNEYKLLSEFHINSHNGDGYDGRCKSCKKILSANYYKTNTVKSNESTKLYRENHPEKVAEMANNYKKNHPNKLRAIHTLKYHERSDYKITVSIKFVENLFINTNECSLCGRKLTNEYGVGLTKSSKSLDRINNENELRVDNVWVICHSCNTTKGDRTKEEFIEYCRNIIRRNDGTT